MPTFRDAQTGLWANFRPEDLATPEGFARDPRRIWEWYEWRRELVRRVEPNAGHHALVQLASLVPQLTLVTQNVDGLHQRAGSTGVIEYHGNILRDRCSAKESWPDVRPFPLRACRSAHVAASCCDLTSSGSAKRSGDRHCWKQMRLRPAATYSCRSELLRSSTRRRGSPKTPSVVARN